MNDTRYSPSFFFSKQVVHVNTHFLYPKYHFYDNRGGPKIFLRRGAPPWNGITDSGGKQSLKRIRKRMLLFISRGELREGGA